MAKLREPLREIAECGLPAALEAVGERWSFMILRASFNGVHHFEEFLSELSIARNILSGRLSKLVEVGILKRTPSPDDRRKIIYQLTDKGLDLLPAMIALRQWGERWETGVPSNPVLCDERDRRPIKPVSIRAHDDREIDHQGLCWIDECELRERGRDGENQAVKKLAAI
ncbi:winged helix-turn-helix transcriptional regulator [Novosphingopyxis sp. YJ-S2-01]|uniref:winged helix-turn-helix transcriptional regulator n=1 Tax=Novosphingopyxis sp. YJ-S2-01 TaxID=2794021 RepID=UPI0018DCF782|nr:helix-turn-helix domain-containing protein [Novosphingopyxis sp. YJ-S2-01]MBH9537157.1 helix-turn-helix transcriptional regulator [Novosphingopyxis sp. YJ-S2-01]